MYIRWILGAIIAIALIIAAVYALHLPQTQPQTSINTPTVEARPLKTFYNPTYGIALNYPDNYAVQEHDATGAQKHHSIIIGDKTALSNPPANSEGPPAMTIDIYDNPTHQTPEKWIKNNSFSNYKLSQNTTLATTTVATIPAFAYPWDGLYRSTSIVFPQKDKIYMLSVGYNSPDDQIRKDFAEVVASIQFDP
jgi:hypothetical protein